MKPAINMAISEARARDGAPPASAPSTTLTAVSSAAATVVAGSDGTEGSGDELMRFFPGFFEILLPVVLSAVPQIIGALQSRTAEPAEAQPSAERFVPELLSVLLPVLSAVMPVIIEQIGAASRDKPEGLSDDVRYEKHLPTLIAAIIPVLLAALRKALIDTNVLSDGDSGIVPSGDVHMVRSQSSNVFLGALLQIIPTAIATVLPQLFALVEGGPSAPRGERAISFADLRGGRLSDGDHVLARFSPLEDPEALEISVRLYGVVNWWKGAQLRNVNGDMVQEAGPGDVIRLSADDAAIYFATGGSLVLGKAKAFGAHSWMYTLGSDQLQEHLGKRITLTWVTD